jgi:hypothetical protein
MWIGFNEIIVNILSPISGLLIRSGFAIAPAWRMFCEDTKHPNERVCSEDSKKEARGRCECGIRSLDASFCGGQLVFPHDQPKSSRFDRLG